MAASALPRTGRAGLTQVLGSVWSAGVWSCHPFPWARSSGMLSHLPTLVPSPREALPPPQICQDQEVRKESLGGIYFFADALLVFGVKLTTLVPYIEILV